MAKPNDTSNPEVTESSPRFVPLLPTSQADMCPRSATLYGHPCTPHALVRQRESALEVGDQHPGHDPFAR